jgi:hypothetical protein
MLTGFSNGATQAFQFAAYPSSGGIQLLEVDSLGQMQGAAFLQAATSFTASDGYGLNLSGTNGAEVDDIAEFTAGSATSNPNITGFLDENDIGAPTPRLPLSGTYVPDAPATGRGAITIPSIPSATGTLNLEYYVVDGSTILFIDVDSGQVATGVFLLQSATSSPGIVVAPVANARAPIKAHAARQQSK